MVTPIAFKASLNFAADLQSLKMPNNNQMRWHKNHESPIDILFLSQAPLHPNMVFAILLFYYLLNTCIQVITVNTA